MPERDRPSASIGLFSIRYVVPALLIVTGQVILVVGGTGAHLEGWAMFTGAGLSVLLLNVLYRAGVSGDVERDREEEARRFFDRHGRWPDEAAPETPEPEAPAESAGTHDGSVHRRAEPPAVGARPKSMAPAARRPPRRGHR